jgi:hypothetical protein
MGDRAEASAGGCGRPNGAVDPARAPAERGASAAAADTRHSPVPIRPPRCGSPVRYPASTPISAADADA